MPRPEFSSRSSAKGGALNPFSSWRARRKEQKEKAEAEAARKITNDTAKNELAIIDTLAGIDFLHSPLPKAVLEAKMDPKQPCGDLEYAAHALQVDLRKNPQLVSADIRTFDEKLLTIALLFKQTVEHGDERAAYAAKGALVRGIGNIRKRIPHNQPELFRQFVEANARYMDSWITLIGVSQVADRLKENAVRQRKLVESEVAKHEDRLKELEERLQNDEEYREAFHKILNNDTPQDRSSWNRKENEVHLDLVNNAFEKVTCALKQKLLEQDETELVAQIGQLETLYAKVARTPIVVDPNLMNKYKEQMDELFQQLAESDQKVDELLQTMDDISGRLEQFDIAPGNERARAVASENAAEMLEEVDHKQKLRTGELRLQKETSLHSLGLRSQEELDQVKEQVEAEERQLAQQMAEEAVLEAIAEVETEAELNYN